jgi:hypothetical protein
MQANLSIPIEYQVCLEIQALISPLSLTRCLQKVKKIPTTKVQPKAQISHKIAKIANP